MNRIDKVKDLILDMASSGVPLTHQALISALSDYSRPNEKIHDLVKEGFINKIKRGIYAPGDRMRAVKPDNRLLANYLLGPSYVSMDTALSWYGMIPEKVYEISSVTSKSYRKFDTPVGVFTYTQLALPYYAFGQVSIKLPNGLYAVFATPEKAICDKIVTTEGIILRSKANAMSYIFDDLRMDEAEVKKLDILKIKQWLQDAPKSGSLHMLIKMIEKL